MASPLSAHTSHVKLQKTREAVIRFPGYISPLFQVYWSLASSTPRVAVLKSATVFSRQAVSVG